MASRIAFSESYAAANQKIWLCRKKNRFSNFLIQGLKMPQIWMLSGSNTKSGSLVSELRVGDSRVRDRLNQLKSHQKLYRNGHNKRKLLTWKKCLYMYRIKFIHWKKTFTKNKFIKHFGKIKYIKFYSRVVGETDYDLWYRR